MAERSSSKGQDPDAGDQSAVAGAGPQRGRPQRTGYQGTLVDDTPLDPAGDAEATRITTMPPLSPPDDDDDDDDDDAEATRVTMAPQFADALAQTGAEDPNGLAATGAVQRPDGEPPAGDGAMFGLDQRGGDSDDTGRRATIEEAPDSSTHDGGARAFMEDSATEAQGPWASDAPLAPLSAGGASGHADVPSQGVQGALPAGRARIHSPPEATRVDFMAASLLARAGVVASRVEMAPSDVPRSSGVETSCEQEDDDGEDVVIDDDMDAPQPTRVSTSPEWARAGDTGPHGSGLDTSAEQDDVSAGNGEQAALPASDERPASADLAPVAAPAASAATVDEGEEHGQADHAESETAETSPPAEPPLPAHLAVGADEPDCIGPQATRASQSAESMDDGRGDGSAAGSGRPAASASPSIAGSLPANLRLPSIDFSMPSHSGDAHQSWATESGDWAAGSSPDTDVSDKASDLPAHLQLPSFPDFDMPEVSQLRAAPPAAPEEQAEAAPADHLRFPDAEEDTPTVHTGRTAPAPAPSIPPPPPRGPQPAPRPKPGQPDAAPMPSLPSFGELPEVAPVKHTKDLTLISSDVAEALAAKMEKRGPLGLLLFALLIVAAGAGAYVYRDAILALFMPPEPQAAAPAETPRERALRLLAAGARAYDAKKYAQAIAQFNKAIAADGSFGTPHRSLGIVFATMEQHDKAVEHYRKYVDLDPRGDDVSDVKKIIADYEKVQKKSGQSDAGKSGRRKKRRGR